MKRRQRKKGMVGGSAENESKNDGSSLVLNEVTKLCLPLPRPVLYYILHILPTIPYFPPRLPSMPCFGMRLK